MVAVVVVPALWIGTGKSNDERADDGGTTRARLGRTLGSLDVAPFEDRLFENRLDKRLRWKEVDIMPGWEGCDALERVTRS